MNEILRSDRTIYPRKGFGVILFGMTPQNVEARIGYPYKFKNPDIDGDVLAAYSNFGINYLCYDHEEDYRLTAIELNSHSRATLFDSSIFESTINDIKELLLSKSYKLTSIVEKNDLDCQGYQVNELGLDFYFNTEGLLTSVTLGVSVNTYDDILWPFDE